MNENTDFEEFRKIPRMNRDCVITEKIDGTNAQVLLYESADEDPLALKTWTDEKDGYLATAPGLFRHLRAGSRTRWITPQADNHGFARWAQEHADDLKGLGLGRHYGEWWGSGIQRGYGLKVKRFSLFNTHKWCRLGGDPTKWPPGCCDVVPVLYAGPFTTETVREWVERLRHDGSCAVSGFRPAEGVVIFHTHAYQYFKVTLEKDDIPKSLVPNAELKQVKDWVQEPASMAHRMTSYL